MARKFEALAVALQLAQALGRLLPQIRQHDRNLAVQLQKAGTSVSSNLSEGSQRARGDRLYHYHVAGGSAAEVHTQLTLAIAWKYLDATSAAEALSLADRSVALTWRLTHPK